MSSTTSSSSLTPGQLIDQIVNTKKDASGFDLQHLVATIDSLLHHYNHNKEKRSHFREKFASVVAGTPSASKASKFSEGVYKNVKIIADQISEYSEDKHQTSIAVLTALGNVHWVGVGFLLVAAVLETMDTIKNNKMECLKLLSSMNDLAKVIMRLQSLVFLNTEIQNKMKEAIHLTVNGAVLCCSQNKRGKLGRLLKASNDAQALQNLGRDVDDMCKMLNLQISASTLEGVQRNLVSISPPVPTLNEDAVGIERKIDEVIQELDWENDKPTVAVVVYGVGGSGKTTLADAVYAHLRDKLNGWRLSKVTLIHNLEIHPKVEKLQSQILQDLTGFKHTVITIQDGHQSLKGIIEKESVFLYIDNALLMEPLAKLLPKEVTSAKKLRVLLTARQTNVSGVIEDCGIEPCKLYPIDSLPIDAALKVLCRKIDRKRDTDSILQERPQAKKIAKICSCCPIFLEVVGAHLHQRKNSVEAYESVIRFLECGENFSGHKQYSFDESRVLFSYEGLQPSAQEAFLDICSFFSDWNWEEVAWIVGEEELECLQEGALVKRKGEWISIHDLILAAGRNKSKQSRFTNADALCITLKNEKLVSQIKGVWLKGHGSPFHISARELDVMSPSLRVFAMGDLTIVKGECSKQFDELRFLQVGTVPSLPIDMQNLKNLIYIDYACGKDMILSSSKNLSSLKVLKFKKCNDSRILGIDESAHLHKIKQLVLDGCCGAEIPQTFFKLHNLQKLTLSKCADLAELPVSLCKLKFLQELDLNGCRMLKQLPPGYGELGTLNSLILSNCDSLQELPCDLEKLSSLQSLKLGRCSSLLGLPERLGNLTSLTSLQISGCKSLSCLPHSIGDLTSLSRSSLFFNGCSSLRELPEEICKYTMLTRISLRGCSSLKMLPSRLGDLTRLQTLDLRECKSLHDLCNDFHCLVGLKDLHMRDCKGLSSLPVSFGKLSSLETLDLSGCDKLEELCSDFHCLGSLKCLYMSDCKSLSNLPLSFGKLSSLKTLHLSGCDNLQELCSNFHCLGALKSLELSKCQSLSKLPDCFGQLGCLEIINLSECSNLEKLSDDFHCLPSLTKLDLSKCERLGGEWMDSVKDIHTLWRVDIAGSERMIRRWMELKRDKEKWHFVVVTNLAQGTKEELSMALMLEGALSKVFDEEQLLFDTLHRPFSPSSFLPHAPLVLIIDRIGKDQFQSSRWEMLEKRLQQLECNSKSFQIIYIGRQFNALPSELAVRILACTPSSSRTSSFCYNLFYSFQTDGDSRAVFRSNDGLEENGIKCPSTWEDISYIWDEVEFLSRTPRESNIELLTALLVTEETDYLLVNEKQQVKVADLQGKVILLLTKALDAPELSISALKDVYLKMQESHESMIEVVWTPNSNYFSLITWEVYKRAAMNAPWPMVPNPWKMSKDLNNLIKGKQKSGVLVVDGKGRICNENALPMIERWGVEAYPFSESREEELRKAFKFNTQPTLEFIFQNVEFLSAKAKEAMGRGEMMFVCVGPAKKMMEFAPHLNCALTMLGCDAQVLFVGKASSNYYCKKDENEYEIKRKEIISTIPSLSFSDVYKFWRRVQHMRKDLNGMGTDEKIVKVRRMVLGFASANAKPRISIVVVDEKGEMISGRGMELVELLLRHNDEDEKEKLLMDIKSGGLQKSMEGRWRDGMIHPKHYPQHPLIKLRHFSEYSCSVCSKYKPSIVVYQCNVCPKYVMCEWCYKKQ